MEMKPKEINLKGTILQLLPERAIFWQDERALICADLHFGKSGHFRKAGIAVPGFINKSDVVRLQKLIRIYKPEKVYFLGDLFHSNINEEWEELVKFTNANMEVAFHLIKGNHDILPDQVFENSQITIHQEILKSGPFYFSHKPLDTVDGNGAYVLSGHIHPGIKLRGKGRQSLSFPCFYFGATQGILPAFGSFTGLYFLKVKKLDQVYAIVEGEVVEF